MERAALLGWFLPFAMGICLFLGLVLPKGSLTVYDTVLNRFQTIQNLPQGLVLSAGLLNMIETGFVNIVGTSNLPSDYQNSAGGAAFNAIYQATTGTTPFPDATLQQSMDAYTKDCVFFELQQAGTTLTIQELANQSTDLSADFSVAANPGAFTTYYSAAQPQGVIMDCGTAWNALNLSITDPNTYVSGVRDVCSRSGYNPDDATQLQQCQSNLAGFLQMVYEGSVNINNLQSYLMQVGLAQTLLGAFQSVNPLEGPVTVANNQMMNSGFLMGIVAADWLPVMRSVFTAIAIGLIPFLCLFLLIPDAAGKSASLMLGFFVWLTCWGIIDCVVHGLATDYAIEVFASIRDKKFGYLSIMTTPTMAQRGLAIFGFAQTASIMLATVFTGVLIKFGGHALAMMAGQMRGEVLGGVSAGAAKTDPGHRAQTLEAEANSGATFANAAKFDFKSVMQARTATGVGDTGGQIRGMADMGGLGATVRGRESAARVAMGKSMAAGEMTMQRVQARAAETGQGIQNAYRDMARAEKISGTGADGTTWGREGALTFGGWQKGQSTFKTTSDQKGNVQNEYKGLAGEATWNRGGQFYNVKLPGQTWQARSFNEAASLQRIAHSVSSRLSNDTAAGKSVDWSRAYGTTREQTEGIKHDIANSVLEQAGRSGQFKNVEADALKGYVAGKVGLQTPKWNVLKFVGIQGEFGAGAEYNRTHGSEASSTLTTSQQSSLNDMITKAQADTLAKKWSEQGGASGALRNSSSVLTGDEKSVLEEQARRSAVRADHVEEIAPKMMTDLYRDQRFANYSDPGERTGAVLEWLRTDEGQNYAATYMDKYLENKSAEAHHSGLTSGQAGQAAAEVKEAVLRGEEKGAGLMNGAQKNAFKVMRGTPSAPTGSPLNKPKFKNSAEDNINTLRDSIADQTQHEYKMFDWGKDRAGEMLGMRPESAVTPIVPDKIQLRLNCRAVFEGMKISRIPANGPISGPGERVSEESVRSVEGGRGQGPGDPDRLSHR